MNFDLKDLLKHTHSLNILFVEDNYDVRIQLLKVLENFFSNIDVEIDGIDAIRKYKDYKKSSNRFYDLVITDLSMPRIDGVDFCRQMRELNPQQLVLVISAHTESDKLMKLIDIGIYKFLQKPVDYKDLLNTLYAISQKLKSSESFQIDNKNEINSLYIDTLTSLYNRKYMQNYLYEKNESQNTILVFIDIDDFKNINEKYSHLKGDKVLKEFSNLIKTKINNNEIFGRWGGEEFAIISNEPLNDFLKRMEEIRTLIEENCFLDKLYITASFGVSKQNLNETISSLTQKTDYALYQAKKRGKNQVFFTE